MSEIALFIVTYLICNNPFVFGKSTLQGALPSNGVHGAECGQRAIHNFINPDPEARMASIYSIVKLASYGKWLVNLALRHN
jgi:hypothetical protein